MYRKIVELNDKVTASNFEKQINDVNNRFWGGIIDEHTGIPSPTHVGTGSVINSWVCSYINKDSKYYHDAKLKTHISDALDYMLKQQHEDGTISPGWTNYHSPPDTGFIVTGFSQVHHLLQEDKGVQTKELFSKVHLFLKRTIPAMLTGGCHTPNHRWVLTSALAHLYVIFGDERLLQRANEWLNEGIDITEDGEWTERSNGIYNTVSNILLYYTSKILEKPKLLDYVRRNLDMMKYLVHPNGEIVTDYSGRQDFGNTYDLSPYHLIYRLMAVNDNDPVYNAMADLATQSLTDIGSSNNHIMSGYLVYPIIKHADVEKVGLPNDYEVFINQNYPLLDNLRQMKDVGHHSEIEHSSMHTSFGAPIVRYRKDKESVTIMSDNSSFFSLRNGEASLLGVQVYSSFMPGLVEFDKIEKKNKGYHLSKQMKKGYTGPISKKHLSNNGDTNVWYLLPHQHRELTHNQTYEMSIDIVKEGADWKLHMTSDDRLDVFTQIMFLFKSDGHVSGKDILSISENSRFWKSDKLTHTSGRDKITIESGAHEHWLEDIRPINLGNGIQTVKVNLVSPINKTFHIKYS